MCSKQGPHATPVGNIHKTQLSVMGLINEWEAAHCIISFCFIQFLFLMLAVNACHDDCVYKYFQKR